MPCGAFLKERNNDIGISYHDEVEFRKLYVNCRHAGLHVALNAINNDARRARQMYCLVYILVVLDLKLSSR